MTSYAKSIDEIAGHFKVTRHAVMEWKRRAGFPQKTKRGWSVKKVDDWLKENNLGPYRQQDATRVKSNGETLSLREAQIKKLSESAERDRIAKEMSQIELERIRGSILLTEDVYQRDQQIAATTMTILEQIPDAIDRAIGESMSPTVRQRSVADVARIIRDALAAIEVVVRET